MFQFPGAGGTAGGAPPQSDGDGPPAVDETTTINLCTADGIIDKSRSYCRNENSGYPYTNLFIGDSRLGLRSDADEQLILHVAFNEFVKIKDLKFTAYNMGNNPDMNPVKVHLHVNRVDLGFEDIDDVDPAQTITLTEDDLREYADPIPVKFVKFQRVKSLTLYFEENAGDPDVTALGSLAIFGRRVVGTNMNDFKRQG